MNILLLDSLLESVINETLNTENYRKVNEMQFVIIIMVMKRKMVFLHMYLKNLRQIIQWRKVLKAMLKRTDVTEYKR